MPQTKIVLVTSPMERANAFMCLVTVTPVMLNVAMEKIPKMQKIKSGPFEKASAKYCPGRSMNGKPESVKTHASTPKVHGMKVKIGSKAR